MSNSEPFGSDAEAVADLPRERTHFKELLLAKHFSHEATPADVPPHGNTTYEQLMCVGYQPQLGQLNAVVSIKQPNGYSGGICAAGSPEYVKFFASTDDGATWTELGTTSFTAWDVPGVKPLEFDVSLSVDLAEKCCQNENIVLIRAILSWDVPPGGPDHPVVWGNGLDTHVQVAPIKLGSLANLFECLKIPIDFAEAGTLVDTGQLVEFGTGTPLSPVQLFELYKGTAIPQHRYLLNTVTELLADPVALGETVDQPHFELVPGLGDQVNLSEIIAILLDPQGNQTYEQLGCVGLNTNTNTLAATVDVKLSSGYSGGLCTAGSQEYVAFWADWGSGYEYVGTTSVTVHDIATLPADGLRYAAVLPFGEALAKRRPCFDGPLIVPIRAVLSWNTPPSTTNPYAVPVWGGHLTADVLIPPGQPVHPEGGPDLESIGSMPIGLINQGSGLATGQSLVSFVAKACPFGGVINFSGHVINTSGGVGGVGLEYRILVRTNAGASPTPLTAPFDIETNNWLTNTQTTVLQTPDPATGWVTCRENYAAGTDVVGNILGYWPTAGDGYLWIAMEARQGGVPIGPAAPVWTMIRLDNTAPSPVLVDITSGAGSCGDFTPGDTIEGTYYAADNEELRTVSISVEMPMPGAVLTQTPTVTTPTSESGTWSLQTLKTTQPCGYTIVATAFDNAIVNSGVIGWQTQGFQGLCLRPA